MLVLTACGSGGDAVERRPDPSPRIEQEVVARLAGRSDEVARLLEGGDDCEAMAESARLRDELMQAISRGVIPEVYVEDLSRAVNEIEAEIPPCETSEAQVPPPPRDEGDEGKKDDHRGKGKHEKKHDRDEGDD